MRASRLVCSVGRTTSWLLRLSSSPSSRRRQRALDPGRPELEVGRDPLAAVGDDRVGGDLGHLRRGEDADAERLQLGVRGLGQPLGQRRQDARPGLDQGHFEPALVEHFEPVMAQRRGAVVELGRQLDPGRAAADDGDADMGVRRRIGLHRARHAQAMIEQPVAEAVGGARGRRARGNAPARPGVPKSLLTAPSASDQIIVADAMRADQLAARPRRAAARRSPPAAPRSIPSTVPRKKR